MPADRLLYSEETLVSDIEAKVNSVVIDEWKPTRQELLIMISLSFISLMVALDATILVTVLPVRIWKTYLALNCNY